MQNLRDFTIIAYFMLTFLCVFTSNNRDINSLELSLAGIAHNYFSDVLKADNDSGKDASELYAQIMGDEIELKLTDFVASDLEGKVSPSCFVSNSNVSDSLDDDVMRVVRSLNREREEDRAFLGTNLFSGYRKPCFSKSEIALLQMRRDFELIIPKGFPKHLLTDKKVCALMKYFGRVNDLLEKIRSDDTQYDAQRAFYDTLGGYLRYRVVPVAKISFYAGQMRLCTVERILHLYNECRLALNTNGNGWRTPRRDLIERLRIGEVEPIKPIIYKASEPNACTLLDLHSIVRDADNVGMLVGLPKLEPEDDNGFILNIALPFKKRRIYNIRSSQSAFILVRFYLVVTRCYEVSGICQNMYNERFKLWIDEELEPHFYDEKFYPGLGGILRVYEALVTPPPLLHMPDYITAADKKRGSSLEPSNSDMPASVINGADNDIEANPSAEKASILEHVIGLVPPETATETESESDSDFDSDTVSDTGFDNALDAASDAASYTASGTASNTTYDTASYTASDTASDTASQTASDTASDNASDNASDTASDSVSDDTLTINNRTKKSDNLQKGPGQKSSKQRHKSVNIPPKLVPQWTFNSTKPYATSTQWPWGLALNSSYNKSHSKINLIEEKEHFWDCWFNPSKYILYLCFVLLAMLIMLFVITVYNLYGMIGCDKDRACLDENQGKGTSEIEESEGEERKEPEKQKKGKKRKEPRKQGDDLRKSEEGCCSRVFAKKKGQSRSNARHKKTDEVIVITSNSQSVQPTKESEEHPRKNKRKPKVKSSSRHRPKSKERKRSLCTKHRSASQRNQNQDEPTPSPSPPPSPPTTSKKASQTPPPTPPTPPPTPATPPSASATSSKATSVTSECLCEHFDRLSECPICSAKQRKNAGRDSKSI